MSSESTKRLSVAIIVRDDAQGLQETLQSVQSMADQIVVLDTGSTDASCDIAKAAGVELHHFAWTDDFSAARNTCLSHVTGEWVLWLDAGEQLEPETREQLASFIHNEADPSKAYALAIQVPPPTPQAAEEQVARIRLIPNCTGVNYEGRVRESAIESLNQLGITVDGLPFRIRRGEREHDPATKQARARRNIRLSQQAIEQGDASAYLLNCLGDAFQTLDENEHAAKFFQQAVKASSPGSSDMLEGYYGLLTSLDGTPDAQQVQLDIAVQANEVFPLDAQLLCALGGYLQALGRTDLAEQSYQTAFRYGQINPAVWHVGEVREIAAICLNITLQLQNEPAQAQQVLEEALASSSHPQRVRRHLIELLVKQGKRDEALAQTRKLPKETPNLEAFRSAVRGACLAVKKNWIAAKAYLKTGYDAGCRDVICLRWYAVTLLASNEAEQAREVLQVWQELDPHNAEIARLSEAASPTPAPAAPVESDAAARSIRFDSAGPNSKPLPPVAPQRSPQREL